MTDKRDDWSYYLEEVIYSINNRPRGTTQYSAFELVHGCRKPRLPIEAESLSFLHPDVNFGNTDENYNNNDPDDLVQAMKRHQQESFSHAGENLLNSKKRMKGQYDKKVNPITTQFAVDDDVLIKNMYRKKSKRGKLQDRWIGLYPIKEISRRTVQVGKDKTLIRVKKAKAKLWRCAPNYDNTSPSKSIRKVLENSVLSSKKDDSPTSIASEVSGIVGPTSQEQENNTQRQEVIHRPLVMKEDVIKSIQKHTPLSPLHNDLLKRCHMPNNELFDWRM
ncbi:Gypsy retrotransposon integrase-like protein 1 [Oopsacas minuta]|uniref:Gypsy retrotransposon integrase-like protein 1 n=1 Tax=Oopsacas minuta TaxID=111878 RepID=A0AAV7JJV3_9METZ|nr:Gypsy retrotransposon integrase-like protein 1 [Oopsacas minuta]